MREHRGIGNSLRDGKLNISPSFFFSPFRSLNSKQETHEGESADFVYGVSAMQGWRTEMVRKRMRTQGNEKETEAFRSIEGERKGRARRRPSPRLSLSLSCLLYTSDAADE